MFVHFLVHLVEEGRCHVGVPALREDAATVVPVPASEHLSRQLTVSTDWLIYFVCDGHIAAFFQLTKSLKIFVSGTLSTTLYSTHVDVSAI